MDDEPKLMTALCEMLREHGYETAGFASAQGALEALKGRDFDVLLTDLMMPEMDGVALLRAALDIDPNLISIVMTGQGTIQTAVDAMKVGAFDYLLKPFKLRSLLPILSRAIQVRHLRADNIQLRETVGIYELSMSMAFALDANTILNTLADAAIQQCGADEASILLPTPAGNELYIAVARGERPRPILGEHVPIEGSIAGWVLRQQQPLALEGEVKDPRFAPLIPRPEIRAAMSMPMVMGGELVGVLNINSMHGRGFRLGQVKALNILATIAASALKNAQLYDQVRAAEEKYRSLFENAAEGIFRTTPEGRYVAANPAMARMLGYDSPEELMAAVTDIGRQLYVNPDRRREFRRLLETHGVLHGFEVRLYRKDGSTVWVCEHARAVRDASGALRFYEGICEDITDRKRAEEELRRHVERLKGLREIDQAILGAHSPQEIAEAALQRIRGLVPCQRAAVSLFDFAAKEGTVLAANVDGDTSVGAGTRLPLDDFWIGQALRQGKVDVVEDTRSLPSPPPVVQALQSEGIRAFVSVPLVVQGTLIGALYLGAGRPGAFPAESVDIASEVADQLAVAIQQARLHAATVRRGEELGALLRASRSVMSGLDLRGTLDRIVAEASHIAGTPHVKVLLVDRDAEVLRLGAVAGRSPAMLEGFRLPLGTGYSGSVAATGEPLFAVDCQDDPRNVYADQDRELGIVTYLGLPIKVQEKVLGVLTFNTTQPRRYTQEEVTYLASFADQAAIAIENARLYREEQQRRVQLEAVRTVAAELTRELDLKKVLDLITRRAAELVGAVSGTVWLWDEAEEVLVPSFWHGFAAERGAERRRLGEGVAGITAQRREGQIVNDYRTSPLAYPSTVVRSRITAVLAEPLLYHNRLLGVVSVDQREPDYRFTPQDRDLLALFADQASIAIENARLYETIRQHAAELEERVRERTRELEAANQQLQEASRHKSEFLANMSHELRTPLNAVIGFAELLQGQGVGPLTEKQVRYLGHIHNSGKHLLQLISDILDLSKVEAGKFVLQPEPLPVAQTLDDILVIARGLANKKGQVIETEVEPNLAPLPADPVRFKQILFNLLSNAVKFTPNGGTITVRAYQKAEGTRQKAESGEQRPEGTRQKAEGSETIELPRLPSAGCLLPSLVIEVKDTGVGIRPEDMPRLFGEFVQLETTRDQKHEGTGLGLALTRRLVELHGGRIWANSEGEGHGSTFTVVLPFDGRMI